MDARITKAEVGLMMAAAPSRQAQEIEALHLAAAQARDAEVSGFVHRLFAGIGAVAKAIITWPQRQAVYEELRNLSDRELADIGLTRTDIGHVFEADVETRFSDRSPPRVAALPPGAFPRAG